MEVGVRDIVAQVVKEMNLVVEAPLDKTGAAKYLKISVKTMERRFREGDLPASLRHHIAGSIYFLPSELHEFIKAS